MPLTVAQHSSQVVIQPSEQAHTHLFPFLSPVATHGAGLPEPLYHVQAVHFRVGVLVEDNHTAGVFVTTMLAILGGPFRLFEMMGLQQPWTSHAIVSVVYLVVHPMAAATGIRYEHHAEPCS